MSTPKTLFDLENTTTITNATDRLVIFGSGYEKDILYTDLLTEIAGDFSSNASTYKLCPLNSSNKIDTDYLPTTGHNPQGAWNGSTNTPTLSNSSIETAGNYYDVVAAGSVDFGSGSITFTVGDVVKSNGTVWYKVDSVANLYDGTSTQAGAATAGDYYQTGDVNDLAAKSTGNGLFFDATNDYLNLGNQAALNFGASQDFTICGTAYFADNPGGSQYRGLFCKRAGGDGYNVQINPSGRLFSYLDTSVGSIGTPDDGPSLAGKIFNFAVVYDRDGNMTRYVNGDQYGSTVSISSVASGTLTNAGSATVGYAEGSSYWRGEIRNITVFNRALSATDLSRMASTGVPEVVDQWGKVAGYTSDFSSGVDGWTFDNGTSPSGDTSKTLGGDSDNVAFVAGSGSTGLPRMWKAGTGFPAGVANKRWRISGEYWLPAGQSEVQGFRVGLNTNTPADHFEYKLGLTTDAWTYFEAEILQTDTSNSTVYFMLRSTTSNNITSAAAGEFVGFRNLKVQQIGSVVNLAPTPGSIEASGKWLDSSSNQLNGVASGSPTPLFQEPQNSGTWSPGLTFGGGSTGMSITGTVGNWRRVGKLCHFSCRFVVNDKGTSEGGTNLTGLPFTSKNNGSSYYATEVMQVGASGMSSLNSACYARINQNSTTAIIFHLASDGSGDAELQHSNFTNGAVLRISGTYEIE